MQCISNSKFMIHRKPAKSGANPLSEPFISRKNRREKRGLQRVFSLRVCADTELYNWKSWGQRKRSQEPENFFPPFRENFTKEASKKLNFQYGLQSQQKRKLQLLWTFFVLFWLIIGFNPFPYTFHNLFTLVSFYTCFHKSGILYL